MVKAIFFDFDGVLTIDRAGWYTTCKNIQKHVPAVPPDHVIDCYKRHRQKLNLGQANHHDIWPELCRCIGADLDIGILPQIFKDTPKNEPMFQLCEKLKGRYTLGIITDNNRERFSLLKEAMNLSGLFDIFVLSADIGAMKDQPMLFQAALQQARAKAGECVFIDNHEENLVVPSQMGFRTHWHDHAKNSTDEFAERLREWGVS